MNRNPSIALVIVHLILGIITGGLWWIGCAIYYGLAMLKHRS